MALRITRHEAAVLLDLSYHGVRALDVTGKIRPFDRAAFLEKIPTIRAKYARLLLEDGPQETTRAALRRLGISGLVARPRPGSKVWDITGRLDLEKALAEVHAEDAADPSRLLTYEQVTDALRLRSPKAGLPQVGIVDPADEAYFNPSRAVGSLGERAG